MFMHVHARPVPTLGAFKILSKVRNGTLRCVARRNLLLAHGRAQEETLEKKRMGLDQIIEFFVATDLDGQNLSVSSPIGLTCVTA